MVKGAPSRSSRQKTTPTFDSTQFRNQALRGGGENIDEKKIHLIFTGGDYNDGGEKILNSLREHKIKTHFFFTGDFYRDKENYKLIKQLKNDGHYLGAHSDKHLLYAAWEKRDSLLITKEEFIADLKNNYKEMSRFGISRDDAHLFLPPFEWYNYEIANWTNELGLTLINFTPGTSSNADYTTPNMGERYVSSDKIYNSILEYERTMSNGLNGFFLLFHVGTDPARTDKFYYKLDDLIIDLKRRGYRFSLFN